MDSKTGEFALAQVNFNALPVGNYPLSFSSFEIAELANPSPILVRSGEGGIIKVQVTAYTILTDELISSGGGGSGGGGSGGSSGSSGSRSSRSTESGISRTDGVEGLEEQPVKESLREDSSLKEEGSSKKNWWLFFRGINVIAVLISLLIIHLRKKRW